tara:strand:- start:165 stop:1124 length:960 start_codon:yes stop_codon:yes gene_type:complete
MKKFILTVNYFFLPILILSVPLDYFFSKQLSESTKFAGGENLVWNDIYNGKINDDIFIYGSSRAWVHISPQILEEKLGRTAYNFGFDGQNFDIQNLVHQEVLRYNSKPKYIIYSLDVFTFMRKDEIHNNIQFLPYMFMNGNLRSYLSSYNGHSYYDYYLPMIRYAGKSQVIQQALKFSNNRDSVRPFRLKGYRGKEALWNDDLKKAKEKQSNLVIKIDSELVEDFKVFLDKCESDNIKVIFVYTPEYFEGQNFVSNRSEIISLYKKIAENRQIPFIDYSDDILSTQREYFYNSSHLNKKGAELFTKKLSEDLINTNLLK